MGRSEESILDKVWLGGSGVPIREVPYDFRITTWNIERGLQFEGIASFLERDASDIFLLQEVDVNAKRSGTRRIHEDLAGRLGMQYAFGPEFEELGQRASASPAYQGNATLTRAAIRSARILRFSRKVDYWRPRWYLPNWSVMQRRLGGRIALSAEVPYASGRLVLVNVHLESRGPESLRADQIREVLREIAKYPRETPVILAGDLNVAGASSPVIRAIEAEGLKCAAGGEISTRRGAPLDWIFVRGPLRAKEAQVHRNVNASDHFPVSVRLERER